MRCWIFDWNKDERFLPEWPGRRWVVDNPNGNNSVLVYTTPPATGPISKPTILLGAQEQPYDDAAILPGLQPRASPKSASGHLGHRTATGSRSA
jgi:hypothetical protein